MQYEETQHTHSPPDFQPFLSVADVAFRLGVSHERVRQMIKDGSIDGYQLATGGQYRVSETALAEYLEACKCRGNGKTPISISEKQRANSSSNIEMKLAIAASSQSVRQTGSVRNGA